MTKLIALSLLACAAVVPSTATAADGPHVVFIIADDIGWNDLGCTGSRSARTPRIDAFAETATRFERAYLTTSSCSPSRASFLLGRYPHNCGKAAELHRPMPGHLVGNAYTALLREAGYHAELVGKHHMKVESENGDVSPLVEPAFDTVRHGFVKGNRSGAATWAARIKDRPADTPCVFWFASTDAHRPWDADKDWVEEKYGPKHDPESVVLPEPLLDTPETRADFASYLNEVARFDYHVGAVLDALEDEGIADETVVVVTSDNGRPFPRAKTRLHDPGMKMPLFIRAPGYAPRSVETALASAVDVAPTILELCGLDIPETVQGLSLVPLLEDGDAAPVRRYAFSEHNWHDLAAHARSVRDEKGYVYIRNARPELSSPGPADSLSSPSHAALRDLREESPEEMSPAQQDLFLAPRPSESLFAPEDGLQLNSLLSSRPSGGDIRRLTKRDDAVMTKLIELRSVMDAWQTATADDLPGDPSGDAFDRETGKLLPFVDKSQPVHARDYHGVPAGAESGAAKVNAPGPL